MSSTCQNCRYLQGRTPRFTCLIGCCIGPQDAETGSPIFTCNHGPYTERVDQPDTPLTDKKVEALGKANRGHMHERVQWSKIEASLAKHWENENDVNNRRNINYGYGILQDLFLDMHPQLGRVCPSVAHEVTPSERMVAATVIQWLGTNCGMAFLNEALKDAGFRIERIK